MLTIVRGEGEARGYWWEEVDTVEGIGIGTLHF